MLTNDFEAFLPRDRDRATLLGRIWSVEAVPGPAIVVLEGDDVFDITATHPLMSEILNAARPAELVRSIAVRRRVGSLQSIIDNTLAVSRDVSRPYFLAPVDVQSLKACGVTFVDSLLERLVEEQCGGDPGLVGSARDLVETEIGSEIRRVKPNTVEAEAIKTALQARGLWSQYLEVGLGPYVEVFTKSQPMSAVGLGADIGLHPASVWNNPEPEVVLAVSAAGHIVGCTLGNDLNLRDFEGRSSLLLGVAKDNNASCAIGPFIRLLDDGFTLDDLKNLAVTVTVSGTDDFLLEGGSQLAKISRPLEDLCAQVIGRHHQYPDGLMLFTGTMFAPTRDRNEPGRGFTHKIGDIVRISSPQLGTLQNRVGYADRIAPWEFGVTSLVRNLASRGYL